MVSVFALSEIDRSNSRIGICCFSAKHATLFRSKRKDWLTRNHNNLSKLSDKSTCRLLFQ